MRLKPSGIILILLIVGFLGYRALQRGDGDGSNQRADREEPTAEPTPREKTSANNETAEENTGSGSTKSTEDVREFVYTPERPEDGKLRGVVEVGAAGFNSFVVNMDEQKRWEIIAKDFGESLAYEGLATTEDIRAGLKKYLASMFDKGVLKKDMHFVISSGAQKEPKTKIIANELKKMGYVVNLVTPDEEARLAFKATVPPNFTENSFMVDIGSGNTKVSWEENGKLKSLELPGAKYYEKEISDKDVYNEVTKLISRLPDDKRNMAFILGGVPFTLAKQHRVAEERYTVLKDAADYDASDKKMASGLNIYKAIQDATGTDTFVFDWDSNFTIGFLLGLRSSQK
jgi:hypothetical protein